MKLFKSALIGLVITNLLWAQDSSQTFLSLRNTGVETFQKEHTVDDSLEKADFNADVEKETRD